MNWKEYWNTNALKCIDNEINQVQRKDLESTFVTASRIVKILKIDKNDTVLDVCCGNGILTQIVSEKTKNIVGVDQSNVLIKLANAKNNKATVTYKIGSALDLEKTLQNMLFDKIYLQFSFQYFDKKNEGALVIAAMLAHLKPNGKIFIGDIPNFKKRFIYYNTFVKRIRWIKQYIFNTNPMGKFWKQTELAAICKKLQVKGTFLKQPKELPYSHYRFDYLIEKLYIRFLS